MLYLQIDSPGVVEPNRPPPAARGWRRKKTKRKVRRTMIDRTMLQNKFSPGAGAGFEPNRPPAAAKKRRKTK